MIKKIILLTLLIPSFCQAKEWECAKNTSFTYNICRINVPHGWLVSNNPYQGGIAFYKDEEHKWVMK